MSTFDEEIRLKQRFEFGANWARFLSLLDEDRISSAVNSLQTMLGVQTLEGLRFLDAGSGSGLFSLAARRLGAKVVSFDFDPQSVACTTELRRRYETEADNWVVLRGSVLDEAFLAGLGQFDIVYSWGVLHHTGAMWQACRNVCLPLRSGGDLLLAIYNDQGWISRYWTLVKRVYQRGPVAKAAMIALHAPYLLGARWLARALTNRLRLERGMSLWYDMLDWLGGYPFEVASPAVFEGFFAERSFELIRAKIVGRRPGCNEFLFRDSKVGKQ